VSKTRVRRTARSLTALLSANRIGFGVAYLLRPARSGRSWIGVTAREPATQVITRGHGARDLVLGAGALGALAGGEDRVAGAWLAGQAVADAADFTSTVLARRQLPAKGVRIALLMAGLGTVVSAGGAIALASRS
jgi:hypothetical protein